MTDRYRRDVKGRFVATSNTPESGKGSFETYTDIPVEVQGADPDELAYGTEQCHAPDADDLAQGGDRFPVRARHPELVAADEHARTAYGAQGAILRDAGRRAGLDGMLAHVVGLEPPAGTSTGVQRRDGSNGARLPSIYQRPDVDQGDRNVNAADAEGVNQRRNG